MEYINQWIEITGNWFMGDGFQKGLIVSQPEPVGAGNLFTQRLTLREGDYQLKLIYDSSRDHAPLKALFGKTDGFHIRIGDKEYEVDFAADSNETTYCAVIPFHMAEDGEIELSARVLDTRMLETHLRPEVEPARSRFAAIDAGGSVTIVRGIPFLSRRRMDVLSCWNGNQYLSRPQPVGGMVDWKQQTAVAAGDTRVKRAYFLGMTHAYDIANGSWYSPKGDHGFSHFVGDELGTLRLRFADGSVENVPLVMGFNVWYGNSWDILWDQCCFPPEGKDMRTLDASLFGGNEEYRETIRRNVGVDDAVRRTGYKHNQRYMFALDLDGRPLRAIELLESEKIYGNVTISAVTLELEDKPGEGLCLLPELAKPASEVSAYTLDFVRDRAYEPAMERIRRVLYTYTDELPVLAEPEKPEGYLGPEYDFRGKNEAILAATYLYWNGPECAAYIGDGGMGCSSQTARWRTTPYMSGMGVWMRSFPTYEGLSDFLHKYATLPAGSFPALDMAWTRGIGELLREAMAFGYDKCVDNYVDWLDGALFSEANPPHWNRIERMHGEGYHTSLVGDTVEKGNRENDGHGICMWGRYMMWLWKARDLEWNRRHFPATRAAVEWIAWQLDTDRLRPGRRVDILYTESECAHGNYDFYSSYNCLHGLKLSMRMAAQLGEMETYARWSALYDRLAQGIYDNLRDQSEFGPIWHTEANCDWQDHAHKLAHLQLATDGDTYTPLEDYNLGYDRLYLEIDRNTYRYLMKDNHYDCLRMYGYGQGMMTQAALLLDEMGDAERFIDLMVTHNYLPRMEKWASPEGIVTHVSGKYYVPVNGYMGQDSHVADSTKAVRLMLGVDDNREGLLRLTPRFPASWTKCSVSDYPAVLGKARGKIDYTLERDEKGMTLCARTSEDTALDVRMGPLPLNARVSTAVVNGKAVPFHSYMSGDSRWVWIYGLTGRAFEVNVRVEESPAE